MNNNKTYTLLTGGLGYIGSHIANKLRKNIIIIDNGINSNLDYKKKLPHAIVYKKKISTASLNHIAKKYKIGNVIHLAGLKSVNESIQEPLKYYNYNLVSTLILLEFMEKFQIKNMVFSSSATIYGDSNRNPKKEDMVPISTNPYGSTKIIIEKLIDEYANKSKDFSCISLRYFNPIGANLKAGLYDKPLGKPTNLMPILIDSVIKRKKLTIFGKNYKTHDGTCMRDYIHVDDLANTHILSLKKLKKIKGHKKINIGMGKGISVLDLIKIFEKVNKVKVNYKFSKRRPGDSAICFADTLLAKKLINWSPIYGYEDMVRDSWNSIKKV